MIDRKSIVLGTQYYRQPTPTAKEWSEDLKKVKDLGMQLIQLRPQWRWHERIEGKYIWDDIDQLLELAEKRGLDVMFKPMLETAPGFVFKKYNGYRIGLKGEKIWPIAHGAFYPGGWLPCFDNPDVIEGACRFVAEAVRRYKDCKTIKIWHAWNEPRSRPIGECCCEHSLLNYQNWLKAEFKNIDALNDFMGKCWASFDDVDVPRDTSDFAEMQLWRKWAATRVAWRVEQVAKTIRNLDSRPIVAHVGMPSVMQDVLCDTSDDYLTRKTVDFYGSSFATRRAPKPIEESLPFLINDWIRSISGDGYYWINELYPSIGSWYREESSNDVVRWVWASIACGAKGVIFWQYKKERVGLETNDAGIVETDGRDNPTSIALKKAFSVINKNSQLFASAKAPKTNIAIVYDFDSDLINRIEETNHMRDSNLSVNYSTMVNTYKTAMQCVYQLFWKAGIQVDVISSHELEKISDYKFVYLPMFVIVNEKQSRILCDYVKSGGKVFAEGGIAQREQNTMLQTTRPGEGLVELFGAQEVYRVFEDGEDRKVIMPDKTELISKKMNAAFELKGGKAVAHYENGQIAMVENAYGSGKAIMTGFSPGLAYLLSPDKVWVSLLQSWVKDLCDAAYSDSIFTRILETEKGKIFFLFNKTDKEQSWVSPNKGSELTASMNVEKGGCVTLQPNGVSVVHFPKMS
jgi:beta-galactosidase GanA